MGHCCTLTRCFPPHSFSSSPLPRFTETPCESGGATRADERWTFLPPTKPHLRCVLPTLTDGFGRHSLGHPPACLPVPLAPFVDCLLDLFCLPRHGLTM